MEKECCDNCKNWSYNNGGVLTSVNSSKCKYFKKKTDSYQHCKHFLKNENNT